MGLNNLLCDYQPPWFICLFLSFPFLFLFVFFFLLLDLRLVGFEISVEHKEVIEREELTYGKGLKIANNCLESCLFDLFPS